ncbi:MAG: glycosyltransferase family 4 protein [bacterium]|nr:glycosyltransferase family 4 protein [bacterium]
MNICMVLNGIDFPPDIRVEKEARALISAGHRIFLLCSRTENRPARSSWNGMEIIRIAPLRCFPIRKLNAFIYVLTLRDLQWKKAIHKLLRTHRIDAFHVHDLAMVGTVLAFARRRGIPVIADLHENYPALARSAFARRKPRLAERFMWPNRWERLERRWGRRCAHVLVVVDEMKERVVAKGIRPEKITVIENTVDVDQFLSLPVDDRLVERFRGDFVISYIGSFAPHRGLDVVVRAMPRLLRDIPNARLLLVGDGEMMPQLRSLAETMALDDRVLLTGWVTFEKVPSYIAASDVCIVPHISTEQTEASGPHKLFQYMLMAKPVVVSSCRSLRRMIEETGAGAVFKAGDSNSFAETVLKLRDPATRKTLGEAGRKAASEKYNWDKTSERLLRLYELLSDGVRP